jgi:hypothetical protein
MMQVRIPSHGTLWSFSNGARPDHIGMILTWFRNDEEGTPAIEQANSGYLNTGGCPFEPTAVKFELDSSGEEYALRYENDPPLKELARTRIGEETVVVFEYAWVAIIQPDKTFVVSRCD